ncbi:polysaccharide biosynthesis tyrosine autokinase [Staphylococcus debuckii]|uniref:Polysaccharide biosynthesis tyrosine autokinase n=1 Tax=Staphylococcus debuckii TaxID=2044912 RepID=A0ABU9EXR9_9STAP
MKNKRLKNHTPLITHTDPKAVISEKFRSLRTNILFSNPDRPIHTIVVTAEKPGAGKSTVAANLAVVYAQAGYKTLIIDGDMRKPSLHYLFNRDNQIGLSSAIIKSVKLTEAVQSTEVEWLDILTSGPTPPNPSELIGSKNFKEVYKTLLLHYNFIVIDTPPVNSVTDAQLLAEYGHNVILVIDAEDNNRDEVKKGKELIEKTGAKIVGVVMNKVSEKESPSYSYYGDDKND